MASFPRRPGQRRLLPSLLIVVCYIVVVLAAAHGVMVPHDQFACGILMLVALVAYLFAIRRFR